MRLKIFVITLLVVCFNFTLLFSQIKVKNNNEAYKIIGEKEFNQNSLWGYINGGADIYLEYGFQHLLVQEVDCGGEKIKIEVYQMIDSKSAYGIFSLYSNPSEIKIKDSNFSSFNKYHVQAVLGCSYISIINTSGTDLAQKCSENFLEELQGQNSEYIFQFPEIIAKLWKMLDVKVKLLKGKLSFENHASEFEFLFDKIGNEDKYYISFGSENGNKTVLLIPNLFLEDIALRFIQSNYAFISDEDNAVQLLEKNSFRFQKINEKDIIVYKIKADYDEFLKLIGK